jgi:hypothetical protein
MSILIDTTSISTENDGDCNKLEIDKLFENVS